MNAIGASILCAVIIVVLFAPRQWALIGVIAGAIFLPQNQQVVIAGLNLFVQRFIELAAFGRVVARGEFTFSRLGNIDRTLLLLYIFTTVVFVLRSNVDQAYRIGVAVDSFLCYFAFRGLVGGMEDFKGFLRKFLIPLTPFVALVLLESFTSSNPFSIMGGGMHGEGEWFRNGRLRCEGSFQHPSLMGTLGASFLPLYISLGFSRATRMTAFIGVILCLATIWASNSGGPISCAGVGVLGWVLWSCRTKMRLFRRGMLGLVIMLTFVMQSPVWYLLARVSDLTGGDGYHRSFLMDMASQHFGAWWLAGMPIQNTADWFPYVLESTGGADMTNYFLSFGITAGVGAMILFIALLTRAFSSLGKAMAAVRSFGAKSNESERILWGLGVTLAIHIFNWLGIIYFDQTYIIWFMQLAVIANLTEEVVQSANLARLHEASAVDAMDEDRLERAGAQDVAASP